MHLVWAFRDGGSYGAIIANDKEEFSIFLEVNNWEHIKDRCYKNLYVSNGSDPEIKEKKIKQNSPKT